LDVCSQESSGHKAVKFGRNTYLNWDYNLTKKSFISEGVGFEMSLFCVDFMLNDPIRVIKSRRMLRCSRHAAQTGDEEYTQNVSLKSLREEMTWETWA
jgi:hypothetical protein